MSIRLLFLIFHAAHCQFHINNLIISTPSPPGETTQKDRTDTVYDEPLHGFPEIVTEKLSPQDIEEFFEKERQKKWNSKKINTSWKEKKGMSSLPMYKTDSEVIENDPIEQEIADMVPRAKGFFEDSGIQMSPSSKPIIRPIGSEAEITMSMSTLPDISAPDMLETLSTAPGGTNSITHDFPPTLSPVHANEYRKIALESAVDMTLLPQMHNDLQKLIGEVAALKKLVYRLLDNAKRRNGKRKRTSRKVNGTSTLLPGRLTATQSDVHFIHTFDEKKEKRAENF